MDTHIGRNFAPPDPFAPNCGCTLLPCGLVSVIEADRIGCKQHAPKAFKTVRMMHYESHCPALKPQKKSRSRLRRTVTWEWGNWTFGFWRGRKVTYGRAAYGLDLGPLEIVWVRYPK